MQLSHIRAALAAGAFALAACAGNGVPAPSLSSSAPALFEAAAAGKTGAPCNAVNVLQTSGIRIITPFTATSKKLTLPPGGLYVAIAC